MVDLRGNLNPRYKHGQREIIDKICLSCGKSYRAFRMQKYCSKQCQVGSFNSNWHGGKTKIRCDSCGKEIKIWKCNLKKNKHHFCSKKCESKKAALFYSGENSSCWNGGSTDYYLSKEWKDWRKRYIKEYEKSFNIPFGCFKCGITKKPIILHHIIPRKKRNESLTFFHFMPLCPAHHKQLEGKSIEEHFGINKITM